MSKSKSQRSSIPYTYIRPVIKGPTMSEREKWPAMGLTWDALVNEYHLVRQLAMGNEGTFYMYNE